MNTRHLGYLSAVVATLISVNVLAFSVVPVTVTRSEGARETLYITVANTDWEFVGGSAPNCALDYRFEISLAPSGSATWSNDQLSGDINLDRNGLPFALTQQIVFCSNSSAQLIDGSFSVNLHADAVANEGIENTTLGFLAGCGFSAPVPCSGSVAITIIDATPTIEASISASPAAEPGPPGGANGNFTISLSAPAPAGGLVVLYAVSTSSTATPASDYQALGSSVTVPAGSLSVDIPVIVLDDDIAEPAETVIVDIVEGPVYFMGTPTAATVSIVDDDTAGVNVSGTPLTVSEDGTLDQFGVVLTSQPVTNVNITVSSGDKTEGAVDSSLLVFNPSNWNSEQLVTVTGVDDAVNDGDIDFSITLMTSSNDSSYAAVAPINVPVTNLDNDNPASAAFPQESYAVAEDVGMAEITIERVGFVGQELVVTFSTDDAAGGTTATAGEDYTSVSEVLVWDMNDQSPKTVGIPVINDTLVEGDETVVLKLEVNGSELPAVTAELVIQDDFIEKVAKNIDPESMPPNQQSIVEVVLTSCPTGQGQGGFQELCTDLVVEALKGGSVANPLKQITPDEAAAARTPAAETVTVQNINVKSRLAALRAGATGLNAQGFSINLAGFSMNSSLFKSFNSGYDSIQPGAAGANAATGGSDELFDDFGRWGIFISGRAVFGDKDPTGAERGYDFNTAGLTIGIDYRFTTEFVAGMAFGYSDNNVKIQGNSGRLDTKGLTFTVYGSWYPTDNFYLDGSVSSGSNDYEQRRTVAYQLSELDVEVSEAFGTSYAGDQTGFTFGSGYDFNKNGWVFGPTLFVEYIDIGIDAYDEKLVDSGGTGFTLGWATHIKKQAYESLIPSIGFQFSKAFSKAWGVIVPQGRVAWAKELKNDNSIISGYFLGDQGQVNFNLLTDALDEDFFRAGLGFSAMFQNNKSAFLMIDGDFGRDLLSVYYINAGFRWEF